MAKHVIHISELEASSRFAAMLARLRAGEEIVIEDDSRPVAVVYPAEPLRRTISESIALAEAHAKESGYEPTLDPDFATDLEEIIKSRKPRNLSSDGGDC
jgi:antitoxin (DNA-binding transcriptional repressor) of toxin-antitoxin stability system